MALITGLRGAQWNDFSLQGSVGRVLLPGVIVSCFVLISVWGLHSAARVARPSGGGGVCAVMPGLSAPLGRDLPSVARAIRSSGGTVVHTLLLAGMIFTHKSLSELCGVSGQAVFHKCTAISPCCLPESLLLLEPQMQMDVSFDDICVLVDVESSTGCTSRNALCYQACFLRVQS